IRKRRHVGHAADPQHLLAFQVGGEHATSVTTGQEVVQADEAELAGVRARAGNEDAPRLEQRPELGVSWPGATRRLRGRWISKLDKRVDTYRSAVGRDDQRIDVDRGH